jgi:hypothetical protein
VLDLAMTELRVRDVGGRHTPLIGLPGRIGTFPDQGSHPGPWSFYLVAPVYRLAGATAWGLELASIVINSAVVVALLAIGRRLLGPPGILVIGVLAAVAVRGYGLNVLTHPWNPYFPVLLWLLLLVAAWAVLAGHHRLAPVVGAVGTVAAQTHVPYVVSCAAVNALVIGVLLWRWRRAGPEGRSEIGRLLGGTLAVVGVLWVPPVVDQLRRDPGNLRMLYRHFAADQPEPAIGFTTALQVFFRHLDAPAVLVDLVTHGDAFVHRSGLGDGSVVGGVVVFALWCGAALLALRWRHQLLLALHAVIAVALAAGALSMSRIFGKVWFYLTLWAWGTLLLVVLSILWTIVLFTGRRDRSGSGGVALLATGALMTVLSLGAVFVLEVPEHEISESLRAVVPATADALSDGVGPSVGDDGRYVVFWQDAAYNGSQGYGLLNELERRGFDVGVHATWRVPATPHRVMQPGSYDAEVHLVSGRFIDEWRTRDGYVEVTWFDRRSDAERDRFAELRDRVAVRLTEIGRDDLIAVVDSNLFGASLQPDLPDDVVADLSEMLLLGEPVAVFLAPAGSTS